MLRKRGTLTSDKRKATIKKYKESHKQQAIQYILDNYEWHIWKRTKSRARLREVEFDIEVSDIKIPDVCPYLGTPLTRIQGHGRQDTNPSLDRVDNSKGYVKGNIEIISDKANRMKNSATPEELVTFAKVVLSRHEVGHG